MALIATDSPRKSNLVKFEAFPELGFHQERAVINDVAGTIKAGTAMGKVTATGKWKVAKQAAADGSQNIAGIYVGNLMGEFVDLVVPANTDTPALVLTTGPVLLADKAIVWDATFSTQAQKDAAFAAGSLAASLVKINPQA